MSKRAVIFPANTSQFLRGDATFETAGGGALTPGISGSNGSFTFSTVTFGNLNGLSFYTSNGSMVGSYTVPVAGAAVTVSDAASSGTIGRLAFTNLNGVTLSLSTGAAGSHTIVGSHNALTSQSNQAFSADASSTFQTLTFQNSNGVSFSNNAGALRVTHDLQYTSATSAITSAALHTSASRVINVVAATNNTGGGTASLSSNVSFSAANGITFYTSAGNAVVASHNALTSQSNQAFSADASSTFQTLTFQDSNGISFSNNAGALRITHGLQFTSATSAITSNALNTSASRVINIVAATNNTAGGTASLSSNVSFSAANGITFYTSAGNAIVASHNALTSQSNQAVSNSLGSFTFQTLNFSDANNVTWGTSAGGIITASVAAPGAVAITQSIGMSTQTAGGGTGGTTGYATGDDILYHFVAGSNVTLSQSINGASGTLSIYGPNAGGGQTLSYFRFPQQAVNTLTFSFAQSTSHFVPVEIPSALSMGIFRVIVSASVAASSTQATTGNTSLSMSAVTSHNFVLYSRGTGASSQSLQSVTSTQVVDQQLMTWSVAANSSQHSVSRRYSLGSQSFTKDYSSSVTRLDYHTSNLTDLTGVKYLDIPFGVSLSAGQWWIGYGRSTTQATQAASISVATRMLVSMNSMLAVSQNTLAMGMLGGATNSSVGPWPGLGSFTTAGGGTTNSVPIANVSTSGSNNVLYMQMMRIA